MRTPALVLLCALVAGGTACGRRGPRPGDRRGAGAAPLLLETSLLLGDVHLLGPSGEERLDPTFGRGEHVALALVPRPAITPLWAVIRVMAADSTRRHEVGPIRVERPAALGAPWRVPFALPLETPTGSYRLEVVVTDARGVRATTAVRLDLVSEPATAASATPASEAALRRPGLRPPPGGGPRPRAALDVVVRDAAGLPRTHYARGEQATLEVAATGARVGDELAVTLRGPEGLYGHDRAALPDPAAGPVRVPLLMPPFGSTGSYLVTVSLLRHAAPVASGEVALGVVGRDRPPPTRLTIEASTVGGLAGRRVVALASPEVPLTARLSGYAVRPAGDGFAVDLTLTAALRGLDGHVIVPPTPVARVQQRLPYRPLRLELRGTLELPRVSAGDYLLSLEAHDGLADQRAAVLRHVTVP
jgi:hypothetical protein